MTYAARRFFASASADFERRSAAERVAVDEAIFNVAGAEAEFGTLTVFSTSAVSAKEGAETTVEVPRMKNGRTAEAAFLSLAIKRAKDYVRRRV